MEQDMGRDTCGSWDGEAGDGSEWDKTSGGMKIEMKLRMAATVTGIVTRSRGLK